jgi:hypothetical protein
VRVAPAAMSSHIGQTDHFEIAVSAASRIIEIHKLSK